MFLPELPGHQSKEPEGQLKGSKDGQEPPPEAKEQVELLIPNISWKNTF